MGNLSTSGGIDHVALSIHDCGDDFLLSVSGGTRDKREERRDMRGRAKAVLWPGQQASGPTSRDRGLALLPAGLARQLLSRNISPAPAGLIVHMQV
jgi:hypothetical protein